MADLATNIRRLKVELAAALVELRPADISDIDADLCNLLMTDPDVQAVLARSVHK